MADYKLDVFATINAMQAKKFNYYNNLTKDQKKGFAPVVVQRWLSGTSNELQIVMLNEYVNPYVFGLSKHPDLLYKLMTTSTQSSGRCMYPQTKKSSNTKQPIAAEVIKRTFGVSTSEAVGMVKTFDPDQLLEAAFDLGYDTAEIKKLKKELS